LYRSETFVVIYIAVGMPNLLHRFMADYVEGERDNLCHDGEARLAIVAGRLPSKPLSVVLRIAAASERLSRMIFWEESTVSPRAFLQRRR